MKIHKNFSLTIDDEVFQKFQIIARSGCRTPNRLIVYLIRRIVEVYESAYGAKLLPPQKNSRNVNP